jgi:hypothetical protein
LYVAAGTRRKQIIRFSTHACLAGRRRRRKRGDRATCPARDRDVVIIGTSRGRIPSPRCRALDTRRGGSGILVDDELARAIRCESATTIPY